jgi:site-specific DNA-methyltransferase (adenine-specific)
VLDPFVGSGTVAITAIKHDRDYIGIDISSEYCEMARHRIAQETKQFKFSFSNPSAFHSRQ